MFDPRSQKRIPPAFLFLISALIGAVCFIGIYGTAILDFQNVGWLFDNDHDLRQHYTGWCAFRSTPWRFPFGLIDTLSYPNSMSVIYTDSIPIFAVLFKLFAPVLPVSFQYFGLFGIISFMLMGGFASILLRRFSDSDAVCLIGSLFYVMSAPVIQRMYYHTALAAQWIVIAALVLLVYDELIASNRRRFIYWALMGFVCVGIHSYFLPMAGMILAAQMIIRLSHDKDPYVPITEMLSFSAAGLINLYILGAFYGISSASGFGLGTFGSNLNTFINPWEIGSLLPVLPLQDYFQYEGMAYLGAGILLLFAIVAAGIVIRRIRKVPEEAFHNDKIYGRVTIGLFAVSFIFAVVPNISFNDIKIVWIPYPSIVEKILSVFRSNGRLVWPAMYILITAAVSFTAYTFRRYRYVAVIVLTGALMLQITDFSHAFATRHELYTSYHPTQTLWDDPEMSAFAEGEKEFIFLYTDNDITMPTAYYGYLHGMRQNNYYFARDIDEKVSEDIRQYMSEIKGGNLRDNAIYVQKEEEYAKDPKLYDDLDAEMIRNYDHIFFKAKK